MTTNSHDEARRLLAAGFKLCVLHHLKKQPVGDNWNHLLLTDPAHVSPDAGGFGMPLSTNGMCSVDFDNAPVAERGLSACGFSAEAIRNAGVATSSTRPGSGGRVTFRVPAGSRLRWLRFTNPVDGTILELRASSPNLQDCLPGTTYLSVDGSGPWVQDYSGPFGMDMADDLPGDLLAWWQRMSDDIDFLHAQQRLIAGVNAQLDVSSGNTLAYPSPHRMPFNQSHSVQDILLEHDYTENRGRFAPPTASGTHGVRPIPGRDDLWQSDHASDPLFGTFDAWTAYVVLVHKQDLASAEASLEGSRQLAAVEGFEDNDVPMRVEHDQTQRVEHDIPNFDRDKTGKIKATINNLLAAVRCPAVTGVDIATDTFRDEMMIAKAGTGQWRKFTDADYVSLRSVLEMGANGFMPTGREMVRDVVLTVADENKFDSAQVWLDSLTWDGVPRIDRFLVDLFSAEDIACNLAIGAYMWTAMAGRVLSPGCQADMVPILVGLQGVGKSTAVKAMSPAPEFFAEVSFSEKDDDLSRKMRGKLVAEIGELRGLHTKELEAIKAFVTRTHEHWIPKYREFETTFPRRLIFIGTTNKDQFLADDTGNRRWLPVRVGQVDPRRVAALAPMLWAEAAVRFRANGVEWQDAQRLSQAMHDEFAFQDEWSEKVSNWLLNPLFDGDRTGANLLTHEVLQGAIGLDIKNIKRADEMRMGSVLRKLGYERKRVAVNGEQMWRFVPTSGKFALSQN
jgi:predicted P-loop ATPase